MAAKRTSGKAAPSASKGAISPKSAAPAAEANDARVAQIKRLIDVMVAAGAVEVEMEDAGSKLRVRLKEDRPIMTTQATYAVPQQVVTHSAPAGGAAASAPAAKETGAKKVEELEGEVFKSPMVGTFYAAPSPEAEPFVKLGDKVKPEQTICIIEAMKVMNEIKAEKAMTILKVLAQNGEPVEFGQPLLLVKV